MNCIDNSNFQVNVSEIAIYLNMYHLNEYLFILYGKILIISIHHILVPSIKYSTC